MSVKTDINKVERKGADVRKTRAELFMDMWIDGSTQEEIAVLNGLGSRQRVQQILRRSSRYEKHRKSLTIRGYAKTSSKLYIPRNRCKYCQINYVNRLNNIYCSRKCYGLDYTSPKGEASYNLRNKLMKWQAVAEKLGYLNAEAAVQIARRYADTNKRPWPPKNIAKYARGKH